jgi:hypothetical protein
LSGLRLRGGLSLILALILGSLGQMLEHVIGYVLTARGGILVRLVVGQTAFVLVMVLDVI